MNDAIQTDVAIVGGGVSGALVAYHLLRTNAVDRVTVIDPRPTLGLGLAYSTPSLRHLLNVPAGKISALPEDADHFLRWLRTNHDPAATAETFAPRAVFGRYIQSLLDATAGIEHVAATAIDADVRADSVDLLLDDGRRVRANRAVLATGNFDPAPLPGVSAAAGAVYFHNAWTTDAYRGLAVDAPVVLVGTGLTAVDVLLRLRELGHRGTVTAVSRHGVFPHRHERHPELPAPAIPLGTASTCRAYLHTIRAAIARGVPWRSAVDSLRPITNALWLALPTEEQRTFRRHLQRRWDVVRHRMAPTIADTIDAERAAGTLQVRHGHLAGVDIERNKAVVTLKARGGRERFTAARVINCTGPSPDYRRVNSPLMNVLFAKGVVSPGPLGGGLRCDGRGAVVSGAGEPSELMFVVGPGRLGTLLESIAVPEIRQQAVDVAALLSDAVVHA